MKLIYPNMIILNTQSYIEHFSFSESSNLNLSCDLTCPGMLSEPEPAYEMLTYINRFVWVLSEEEESSVLVSATGHRCISWVL